MTTFAIKCYCGTMKVKVKGHKALQCPHCDYVCRRNQLTKKCKPCEKGYKYAGTAGGRRDWT